MWDSFSAGSRNRGARHSMGMRWSGSGDDALLLILRGLVKVRARTQQQQGLGAVHFSLTKIIRMRDFYLSIIRHYRNSRVVLRPFGDRLLARRQREKRNSSRYLLR